MTVRPAVASEGERFFMLLECFWSLELPSCRQDGDVVASRGGMVSSGYQMVHQFGE